MNNLQGLNKKLSAIIDKKISQTEAKNLFYLTGLTIFSLVSTTLIFQNPWISNTVSVLIIWKGLSIDKFNKPVLREDWELSLAVITQLGDLATTGIGIREGLTERNPFINQLISETGIEGFAVVKIIILALIIYIYRRKIENYRALVKIAFIIGLYLTAGNLMALWCQT